MKEFMAYFNEGVNDDYRRMIVGNYIPELAATILHHQRLLQASFINFKGILVSSAQICLVRTNKINFISCRHRIHMRKMKNKFSAQDRTTI